MQGFLWVWAKNREWLLRKTAFHIEGLTRTYHMGDAEVRALRGLSLDVFEGEFVVMLGPSGSGKSTFLNILGGLDKASSGAVHFQDHDILALDDEGLTQYRRDHVGFIFQFYNLIPSLTALENVALVTDIAANPMPPMEALERVGLSGRAHHFPSQLSGGEQQRVAIARAIVKRPDLLLCDEPTGALDSTTGVQVLETLVRANEELGTTVMVVTHNAATAQLAHRVLHFADGQIVNEVVNKERLRPADISW